MVDSKKRKIFAALAAAFLLLSTATVAINATYVYGASISDDKSRPWVRILSPASHSIVASSTGSVMVSGIANDKLGGSGVKVVEVKVNGSRYTTAKPVATGDWSSWSVTIKVDSSGIYRVTPRVTDYAGNQAWNSIYVKVVLESTPPTLSITSPQSGATVAAGTVTVNGGAHDSGTGIRSVSARLDGGSAVAVTPKSTGDWSSWSVSFSSVPEGQHSIYASAIDRAGNTKETRVDVTARAKVQTADTVDPYVSIAVPSSNSEVVADDGTILIRGTASDSGSGVRVVELRIDDGSYKTATPKAEGDWSSWSVNMPVSQGERRLVPRATDNAGNQAWNSIYITVVSDDEPEPVPVPEPEPEPEPEPTPTPSGDLDQFGIAKLYPTAAGSGNEYYTKTNADTVTEFRDGGRIDRLPSGFSKNSDGSWNIPSDSTPRWVITGGWKNMEMTMQIRINSGSLVQLYSNGEQHTTDVTGAWHGSANKMRVYADGRMGFVKELYHESGNSGYTSEIATRDAGASITGKWVTVKFVGYTLDNDTKRKLEAYISPNNDNRFVKVAEYLDSGGWSASSRFDTFMSYMKQRYPSYVPENRDTGQDMRRNEVITWEGDWVSFRSDGADYDFKNVSVREIFAGNGPDRAYLADTPTMPASLEQAYAEPEHHDD
jgi:hypothetical protein